MAFGFSKKTGSPSKSDLALMGGAGLAALGGPIAPMILAAMYAGSEDDKKRMAEQEEEKLRENMMRADLAEINRRAASGNPNYQGPRTMEGQLFGRQAMNAEELMGRASPEYAFANAQRKFNPQPMAPKDRYVHIPDVGLVDLADPGGPSTTIEAPKDEGSLVTLVSPDGRARRTANARSPWARSAMESGWVEASSLGGQRSVGQMFSDMGFGSVQPGTRPVLGPDGLPTGALEPQPGGEKDPTIIEQQRIAKLKAEMPEAQKAVTSLTLPLNQFIDQVKEIKKDPNTRDVVGAWEGARPGETKWRLNPFTAQGNANAASRIENLRNLAQTIGVQLTRSASKTGGAGGNISVAEWPKFESQIANLDPTQDEETFNQQLTAAENAARSLLDAINTEFEQTYGAFLPESPVKPTIPLTADIEALLDKYAPVQR